MNAPKLRFKEFSGEWKQWKLEDLAEVRTGKAFSSADFNDNGEYLVVTNKNIQDKANGIAPVGDRIDIYDDVILNNYLLSGDNILVTMDGVNIGKTGKYSNEKAVLAQRVGRLNSEQLEFVYQITSSNKFVSEMNKLSVGNAIKHISLKQISDYSFSAPISEEEQEKIGAFFKNSDQKIQLQKEKIDLLKEQKKGLMQRIFSQELRFKDENGEEYPEWRTYKLSELVTFFKGQALSKSDLASEGVPCVLYGQLYTMYGEIIDEVISKTQNNSGFNGEIGDVLIPSSGETAIDIACASALSKNALLGGDLNVLRPNKKLSNGNFLAYLLSNAYKNELYRLAQGASVVHLYNNSLKSLLINLPIIEEQQKIVNTLIYLDKKIKKETDKISELAIQKQAFMQQMFV
ncbi:restriction endonuclease subunit S [Paenisporosarcina sp. TG20]|uniref:restriction endonuclease subunit S n=1 Tax=Paenisporosarcina sp. TG20 TaxID=1211706 RepID=UPI0003005749|nr:restriction endonuclease subunit S [Paenisporosarcina sp. TG20]